MKPLGVGTTYLLTYKLAGDDPVSVIARYCGLRKMVVFEGYGHAFEVGKSLLVVTEAAIVKDPVPSPMAVGDVA